MESNEYLMKLLNIPNKTELQNFLSKPDRPTGEQSHRTSITRRWTKSRRHRKRDSQAGD